MIDLLADIKVATKKHLCENIHGLSYSLDGDDTSRNVPSDCPIYARLQCGSRYFHIVAITFHADRAEVNDLVRFAEDAVFYYADPSYLDQITHKIHQCAETGRRLVTCINIARTTPRQTTCLNP